MQNKKHASNPSRILIVILVGFALLSLAYSLATQLKYGPDEPAHFVYIRSIATKLTLPPVSNRITDSEHATATHAGHHPPLYYALMAVPYATMNAVGLSSDLIWRILRILGIGIGVGWIYWVYRLALEYFGRQSRALAVAAFVALIPNAAYTAGVLNNEILVALLFTWAMATIIRYFKTESLPARQAAALGVAIGLSILTKAQGLILIPVFLIVSLAVCRRRSYSNAGAVVSAFGIVVAVALVVGGWWPARCYFAFGAIIPRSLYNPVLPHGLASALTAPGMTLYTMILASRDAYGYFWTPFWLIWKYVSWWHYFWPVIWMTAIAVTGLIVRWARKGLDRSIWVLLFTAVLVWASWMRHVLVVDSMANLQGRLFMCVAAIIGIVFVISFEALTPNRAKKTAAVLGILIMLLGNAAVLACEIAFYAAGGV